MGLQNLTESFVAAKLVHSGVYALMHGTVYPVDQGKDYGRVDLSGRKAILRGCDHGLNELARTETTRSSPVRT